MCLGNGIVLLCSLSDIKMKMLSVVANSYNTEPGWLAVLALLCLQNPSIILTECQNLVFIQKIVSYLQ